LKISERTPVLVALSVGLKQIYKNNSASQHPKAAL
jgi:hypothetical protein